MQEILFVWSKRRMAPSGPGARCSITQAARLEEPHGRSRDAVCSAIEPGERHP